MNEKTVQEITTEILELYKERCGNNPKETVKEIVYILDAIRNDPDKFTLTLDMELEDYAKEYNVCPMCGERLKKDTYNDPRECYGSQCKEEFNDYYCPNHGQID